MKVSEEYFVKTDELRKQYGEKTIVLMQIGSFFEVYGLKSIETGEITGSNILDFHTICDFAMSDKAKSTVFVYGKVWNLVMAGFPESHIEKYIDKLQSRQYTIAIYKQGNDKKSRDLDMVVSPGTYFTNDQTILSNFILCIRLFYRKKSVYNNTDKIIYGLASLNVITGECNQTQHTEIYAHNPSTYDFIERYISIYNPSEVIILYNSESISERNVKEVSQFIGTNHLTCQYIDLDDDTEFSKSATKCEKQNVQKDVLDFFYPDNDIDVMFESLDFYQNTVACHAFTFLLEFVYNHNKEICRRINYPKKEFNQEHLHLANHSLKQLNIISDDRYSGKTSSIVDFVDHCDTFMGKRHLRDTLLHPITDSSILAIKYDKIDFFNSNEKHRDFLKGTLRYVHDIEKGLRKIIMNKCNIVEIIRFYRSLESIHKILQYCIDNESISSIFTKPLKSYLENTSNVLHFLSTNFNVNYDISLEAVKDVWDIRLMDKQNKLSRNVFASLDAKEKEYVKYNKAIVLIRDHFSKIVHHASKKKSATHSEIPQLCKIHSTEKSGIYLKITKTRGECLKAICKKMKTIEIEIPNEDNLYISSNLEFTTCTPNEKRISNDDVQEILSNYSRFKNEFEEQSELCFRKCVENISVHKKYITDIISFISELDVTLSHSVHSTKYNYCKPSIYDNTSENTKTASFFRAKNMRHALIEVIQTQETYVANDIELGEHDRGILLYGTNAVGKSSLIKAIGICIILAQSGCFVPCDSFAYSPYYKIFTRILGNDNIFKGLSTFAVEMSELNVILRNVDENSLVLGDELCSGTEMGSAISIFVAGLLHLDKKMSTFMFATHFHDVLEMEEIKTSNSIKSKHLSVVYEPETDTLIYNRKLQDGPGNNLYGLEVCKSLRLPVSFLEHANEIRLKTQPANKSITLNNTSSYNRKKLKSNCEKCGRKSIDVHHLLHQHLEDKKGFIGHVPKNHKANLINVCRQCHDTFHQNEFMNKYFRKTKTTKGVKLTEIKL